MMHKRFLAAALAALTFFAAGGQALAQRGGVVLIDREKVITDSRAFQSITEQLQTIANASRAGLEQQQATLQQQAQALEQTKDSLSKDDLAKRVTALRSQELDLLAAQEIAQQEITIARNNALAQLEGPLTQAVEQVAKKKRGAMVLEKAMVVYAGNADDVTDDVLKELNRSISQVQVVKPTVTDEQRMAVRQELERRIAMQQVEAVGRQQLLALGQQSLQAAAQRNQ